MSLRNASTEKATKRLVGGWQCQHCYLSAMQGWAGEYPNDDDDPTCCYGDRMQPYQIRGYGAG